MTVLTREETTFWLIALAVGAVVVLTVLALLTMLILFLRDVKAAVGSLGEVAPGTAGGDAETVTELDRSLSIAEALEEEIVMHRELVSGR